MKDFTLKTKDGSEFTIYGNMVELKEIGPEKKWVNFHMTSGKVVHCNVAADGNLEFDKLLK